MPTLRVVLFVAFLIVPLIELAVIAQVGRQVGLGWTLLLLVAVSIAGAALVRREGMRSWRRFREALDSGRVPTDEVFDGALVLLGGALMLTPGFVTDGVGLLLMLSPGRALVRRAVRARIGLAAVMVGAPGRGARGRPAGSGRGGRGAGRGPARSEGSGRSGAASAEEEVVEVEVVNVERTPPEETRGS